MEYFNGVFRVFGMYVYPIWIFDRKKSNLFNLIGIKA